MRGENRRTAGLEWLRSATAGRRSPGARGIVGLSGLRIGRPCGLGSRNRKQDIIGALAEAMRDGVEELELQEQADGAGTEALGKRGELREARAGNDDDRIGIAIPEGKEYEVDLGGVGGKGSNDFGWKHGGPFKGAAHLFVLC